MYKQIDGWIKENESLNKWVNRQIDTFKKHKKDRQTDERNFTKCLKRSAVSS